MKKIISCAMAAVMAVASLPILSAGAQENTYALGDVDMDGVITGHDSAMVSRAMFVDTFSLTPEQVALADVNQDGTVDQADADWIHENEVYFLGDINFTGLKTSLEQTAGGMDAAWLALNLVAYESAGGNMSQVQSEELQLFGKNAKAEFQEFIDFAKPIEINEVEYHLLDANANGEVSIEDAYLLLRCSAYASCGASYYQKDGAYYLYDAGDSV